MNSYYDDDDLDYELNYNNDDEEEYIGSPRLIAIIGDEDTCVGFVLGGIGQCDEFETPNYFVVEQKTDDFEVEKAFRKFINRKDVGLILITKEASEKIDSLVKNYKSANPALMVIPGHNGPYEIALPACVKDIEERRRSSILSQRRDSTNSTTSLKTLQSHHSRHSIAQKSSNYSMQSMDTKY